MKACPSLGKVLDYNTEPIERYCDHCESWIRPSMDKLNYYLFYDVIDYKNPQCLLQFYKDPEEARNAKKAASLMH